MARIGVRIFRSFKAGAYSTFSMFTTPGSVFMFMDIYAEDGSAVLNPMTMQLEAHPSATDWTIWFNEKVGQDTAGTFQILAGSNDYDSIPSKIQLLQDCAGDGTGQLIAEIFPTGMVDGMGGAMVIPNSILVDPFPACAPPVSPAFWTAFVNSFEIP